MDSALLVALILIVLGTYSMRVLPFIWMQRHIDRREEGEVQGEFVKWLGVLGPTMIGAMLGASLVPETHNMASWLATSLGVVATYVIWHKTKTLGLPVFIGVIVYGGVLLAV